MRNAGILGQLREAKSRQRIMNLSPPGTGNGIPANNLSECGSRFPPLFSYLEIKTQATDTLILAAGPT